MVKYILVFTFLIISFCFANQASYYNAQLGEKESSLYDGKFYPSFHFDEYLGQTIKMDDEYYGKYPYQLFDSRLYDLKFFMNKEFTSGALCPNHILDESMGYIQYSYRLITMSYLLELLLHYEELYQDNKELSSCHLDMKALVKQCNPKTKEMVYYTKNIPSFYEKFKNIRIKTQDLPKRIQDLQRASKTKKYLYSRRYDEWCKEYPCLDFKVTLQKICHHDQQFFIEICSEKDSLKGISYSNQPYDLLSRSHIINNFNQSGHSLGCMKRYTQIMQEKEKYYPILNDLFPIIRDDLERKYGPRFSQGMLFIPGSLKEFRDKGLAQVFEKIVEEEQKMEAKVAQVSVTKVTEKKNEKKRIQEIKPKEIIVAKKIADSKTAFEEANDLLKETNLDKIEIDMLKFQYDYVFTLKVIDSLEGPLQSFMAQKTIKEMKQYDHLGTKKGPVPLLFLKYMLDTHQHQGLYNLIFTIGNKFYVRNNIDKKANAYDYIELENNFSTNNQWKISLLRQSGD